MNYRSTRQNAPELNFEGALLAGLAEDGGLYLPTSLPQFDAQDLARMAELNYQDLALEVMYPFVEGSLDRATFKNLIAKAYSSFNHTAVAPLVQTAEKEWVLELFHGPTLAFKDFALQLLGQLLDHFLSKNNKRGVVMGATSGDTGSAAIEACVKCKQLDIFILHPHERVSEVQRLQMTSVIADNVRNIALKGNFDDCQQLVKSSFSDQSFLLEESSLIAVNSINWARIMAQIVYYFYAGLSLGAANKKVSFSVPTGNFGDIYAGYLAKQMGLPVNQLIVATNSNNILHRAISNNDYSKQALTKTFSPSMDIMVSSNFERLLANAMEVEEESLAQLMTRFEADGQLSIPAGALAYISEHFNSADADDQKTIATIAEVYRSSGYLADPHTAIGIAGARECREDDSEIIVCLATAHPAKFSGAIEQAGVGVMADLPVFLSDLLERPEAYQVLDNNLETVQQWITQELSKRSVSSAAVSN